MTRQDVVAKLRKAKGLWFCRQGMNDMAVINTTRPTCRLVRINPREGDDAGLTDKAVQPVVIQVDSEIFSNQPGRYRVQSAFYRDSATGRDLDGEFFVINKAVTGQRQ